MWGLIAIFAIDFWGKIIKMAKNVRDFCHHGEHGEKLVVKIAKTRKKK